MFKIIIFLQCKSTGCLKKVALLKLFGIFSFWLSFFCTKFCKFVGYSYPHISTNFSKFILIFPQVALIFPGVRGRVAANTSHLFCRNCTGCLSDADAMSTSNWPH